VRQGSVFTQKPYLTCVDCNTGWMKDFEDQVERLAALFSSSDSVTLEREQTAALAGWITLITILAEYIDTSGDSLTTTRGDLESIRLDRQPPAHWSIFAASLAATIWAARYRHHATRIDQFTGVQQFMEAVKADQSSNTQTSSFGIGRVFFQIFSTPEPSFVTDYRITAKGAGLTQIWPLPPGRLWPYAKEGAAKFPTQLVLTDQTADELANAYPERIKRLTKLSV
jgi:hypothetical protein